MCLTSDGPSPHSPSLRLGLPAPQPSRRHRAHSLLGPSFHDLRTPHVLESHPKRAAPLSRATMSDDMLSALTPPLHCASILQPATSPRFVAFESKTISAPICLDHFTFVGSRKPDIWTCVCFWTFSSSAGLLLFWWKWTSALSPCLLFGRYHHSDSSITLILVTTQTTPLIEAR